MKKAIILIICVLAVIYATVAVLLLDFGNFRIGTGGGRADDWMIVQYMLVDEQGNFVTDANGNNVFHNQNVPLYTNKETGIAETRSRQTRLAGANLFSHTGYDFDAWWIGFERFEARAWIPGGLTGNYLEVHSSWTPKLFQVTFHPMGGTPTPSRAWVRQGDTYGNAITGNSHITRTNFTFIGWFTAQSGGVQVLPCTVVSLTGNITLYARWSAGGPQTNQVTATYVSFAGGVPIGTKAVTIGQPYGTLATPLRNGYRFDGWFTDAGVRVTANTIVTATSNHNLTARWTQVCPQVVVTYMPGIAGQGALGTKPVTVGQPYGALATPARAGYTFQGWFTDAGVRVTATTIVTATTNHNLTARWA